MKGIHPYLDSRTAGLNMIDAVRALRRTFPDVSDRWVAVGDSQGGGAHYWNVLSSDCTPAALLRQRDVMKEIGPKDFTPRTPEAAAHPRQLPAQWALPQKPLSAPLYVWYGGRDPYIDFEWTKAALANSCALGGVITIVFEPDGGHNPPDADELVKWMADRFAGKAPQNDC